jgi:hypothetical protein
MSISYNVFSAHSFNNFKVSGLILRPLIHFELILLQGERHGSSFSFLDVDIQFFQKHLRRCYLFFTIYFGQLCQKPGGHSCVDSYLGMERHEGEHEAFDFLSLANFTSDDVL